MIKSAAPTGAQQYKKMFKGCMVFLDREKRS